MTEHRLNLTALAEAMKNGAHSIFSASGSPMWSRCSGSLIPNILSPDTAGEEAAEGTVAHGVGEVWLRKNKKPRHLVGSTEVVYSCKPEEFDPAKDKSFRITITHEMLDQVQRYVDWCWSLPGTHYVEQRVDYSIYMPIPHQGGTMDHAACWWQNLVVTDLKYGKGVQVFAKDNSQLMLYALGFFLEWDFLYDFQDITLRIAQPRLEHFDVVQITRQELLAFGEEMRERAAAAWQVNAERTPGEKQCQWCKVKPSCGAFAAFQDSVMSGVFRDLTKPITVDEINEVKEQIDWMQPFRNFRPVADLDTDQMSVLYRYKGMMEGWWKALDAELKKRAAKGDISNLLKLVEGRSRRYYPDEEKAVKHFVDELEIPRDEVVVQSVQSPAEMEKILRKHGYKRAELQTLLEPVVGKPRGKPSLVSVADRRPALGEIDDSVYRDLTNPEPENEEL